MQLQIPDCVRTVSPGHLVIVPIDTDVVMYVREEDWGMKKYRRQCPAEIRLGTWEIGKVLATALLARLARSDLTTFEFWINAGDPNGVRMLQCLGSQPHVDIHVVADSEIRSLRVANHLRFDASMIVNRIRGRNSWSLEDFQAACLRIAQLYPTPHSLWWACEAAGEA